MLSHLKIKDVMYVAGLLISLGVLWGTTSAKVSSLEKDTSSLKAQVIPNTDRLARIEQKIDNLEYLLRSRYAPRPR